MLCHVVLEECDDFSVESVHLVVGMGVLGGLLKWQISKRTFMSPKRSKKNCDSLSVSTYVS